MISLKSNYSTIGSFILSADRQDDLVQEILALLPYEYFKAADQDRNAFWTRVITAIDGGEQDVTRLAQLYEDRGEGIAREVGDPVDRD